MLHVIRNLESRAQPGFRLIPVTQSAAQLIVRDFDGAAARKEIGNTSDKLSAIDVADDSGAPKQMVACVVVDLEVRRAGSTRRNPHRRNDWRHAAQAIREG